MIFALQYQGFSSNASPSAGFTISSACSTRIRQSGSRLSTRHSQVAGTRSKFIKSLTFSAIAISRDSFAPASLLCGRRSPEADYGPFSGNWRGIAKPIPTLYAAIVATLVGWRGCQTNGMASARGGICDRARRSEARGPEAGGSVPPALPTAGRPLPLYLACLNIGRKTPNRLLVDQR